MAHYQTVLCPALVGFSGREDLTRYSLVLGAWAEKQPALGCPEDAWPQGWQSSFTWDSVWFCSRGRHESCSFEVDQFNFSPLLSQAQLHPRLLSSCSLLLQVTLGPVSQATRGAGVRVCAQCFLTLGLCSRLAPTQATAPGGVGWPWLAVSPHPAAQSPPLWNRGENR